MDGANYAEVLQVSPTGHCQECPPPGKWPMPEMPSRTLGWSDLALFPIFVNLHISVDQVYFRSLIPQIRQFRPRERVARVAKFSFS